MSQSDYSPGTPAGGALLPGATENNSAAEPSAAPEREIMQGSPGSLASPGGPQRRDPNLPLPGFVKIYLASLYITLAAIAVTLVVSSIELFRAW